MEEDKWRDMKYAAQQMPGLILQDLYNQLSCLHARIHSPKRERQYPTDEESIIQRRLMMSIKNAEKQSVGNYMQIITEILNEVAKQSPQLAHDLAPFTDKIIKRKLDKKTFRKNAMFLTDEPYEEEQQEQPEESLRPSAPESAPISGNHLAMEPENVSSPSGLSPERDGLPPDRDGEKEGQPLAPDPQNVSSPSGLPPDRDGEKEGQNACMPNRNVPPCDISENIITAPTNDSSPSQPKWQQKNLKNGFDVNYDLMPKDLRDAWMNWWAAKSPHEKAGPDIEERLRKGEFPPPIVQPKIEKRKLDVNTFMMRWIEEEDRKKNQRFRW